MAVIQERRRALRRMVNFKVQHRDPRTQKMACDFARDLSVSGLFLRTKRLRPVGLVMDVAFPIDDLTARIRPLRLQCEVTRTTPEGVGARFTSADPEVLAVIQQLIAS